MTEPLTARDPEVAPGLPITEGSPSRLLSPPTHGERVVELGFLLGWHVAELFYLPGEATKTGDPQELRPISKRPAYMTTLDDLSVDQKARLLVAKMGTDARALTAGIKSFNPAADLSGLAADDFEKSLLADLQSSLPGSQSFQGQVIDRDIKILLTLQAADESLGRSYMLARDLASVVLNPSDTTAEVLQDQQRLHRIHAALEDLKSRFAQWAADAVSRNLSEWQTWATLAGTTTEHAPPSADTLLRQAEIWRAMLAGEKVPSDFLRPKDYLDANRTMLLEFTRELRSAVTANRRVVAAIAVMALVAVAAIVAAFVTGITLFVGGAIVAMLGLVGVTGSRALARLRELSQQLRSMLQVPALEAELMRCVAYATCQAPRSAGAAASQESELNASVRPGSSESSAADGNQSKVRPWWRRVFAGRTIPRPGRRPISFATAARWLAIILIALALIGGSAGIAAWPETRNKLTSGAVAVARDLERQLQLGEYAPVRPETAQGSSEIIGHQAQFVIEPNSGYWAADTSRDPQPVIILHFAQITDLDYLVIARGAGTDYATMGRPRKVNVSYFPGGASEDLTLRDDPRPTRYPLHGRQVSSVHLRIMSVYPAADSTLVALGELDLYALK